MAPAGSGARLGRLARAVAYSLLPLVVLVVVLEVTLAAAGLGDPDARLSLLRGFDENARYIEPVPDRPGVFVTQMWQGIQPEVTIPPRDGRVRILLLGGSNAQHFPTKYLQRELDAASPDPGFEVINLGRSGYGSERVRILLGPALQLQPDIVLIYVGHNEFMEHGFAAELVAQWKLPWIQRAAAACARLRTVNVMLSWLESLRGQPSTAGRTPEAFRHREDATVKLTWDQTLIYHEQYRRNLRVLCAQALQAGAQVMISTAVENVLDPPTGVMPSPGLTADQIRKYRSLDREARLLIPERFRLGWIRAGPDDLQIRLKMDDWGEGLGAEALAARRLARGPHPDPPALRPLQPPLDTGPYWTDPSLWRPRVDTLLSTMAAVHERALRPGEAEVLHEAVGLLEQARAISSEEPSVLHTLAACLYLLGEDDARAVALFRQAGRYDRAPTHANDATNDIVRAVAAEFPEVALVDSVALFRARCPDGLIGYEVMMDNCHMHSGVRPKLMDDFLPALLQLAGRVRKR